MLRKAAAELLKRLIDIIGAGLGLLFLSPVLATIAIIIKRSSPGPVLFRQARIGRGGTVFHILKFRSMRSDAEHLLRSTPELWSKYVRNNYKLPDREDPRVTEIGRWLRKTSLDEIPQLWNVLSGDMSLVGPRPLVREEIEEWYPDTKAELLSLRPGMTGLWQVSGRSDINYPQRADLELQYVQKWSVWHDFKILFGTVKIVATGRGAF